MLNTFAYASKRGWDVGDSRIKSSTRERRSFVGFSFADRPCSRESTTLLCDYTRTISPQERKTSHRVNGKLRRRKRRRTTLRRADSRGYYLARKFLLRTHGTPFFFFFFTLREPLRRCHVRPCQPHFSEERPLFPLSTLPRSLSFPPPPSTAFPLFLFPVAQIYVQRQGSLSGVLVRDARLEFPVPFPCLPLSKARPFVHGFPWKIELNDSQSNIHISRYYSSPGLPHVRGASTYEFFFFLFSFFSMTRRE